MYTDKYDDGMWNSPSMDVVRARHRAAMDHKCHCGSLRDPSTEKRIGSRRWISCERCFGQIKQLS